MPLTAGPYSSPLEKDSDKRGNTTVEPEGKFFPMPRRIRVYWYMKRKNKMDMELILNSINYISITVESEDKLVLFKVF